MRRNKFGILTLGGWLLATTALAQAPRIDFAHPVAGETLIVTTDGWAPGAPIVLTVETNKLSSDVELKAADGAGYQQFTIRVPESLIGREYLIKARSGSGVIETEAVRVTFRAPELLLTGTSRGDAYLYRVAVPLSGARSFDRAAPTFLGRGQPGGAVRDGRSTKTFVVADVVNGVVRVVPDDPALRATAAVLQVPPGVRGIAVSPDGSKVLVVSAVTNDASDTVTGGVLTIIDARTDRELTRIALDPLGAQGGRIVASPDGLRAFVAVQGLFLREVNLLGTRSGQLVTVGRPGQDRIQDLRIVDGSVFALTQGAANSRGAVTNLALGDFGRYSQALLARAGSSLGFSHGADRDEMLLLDGAGGEITVIDTRTMRTTATIPVPPGADALLLTPDPGNARGALLYGAGGANPGGAVVRPVNFAERSVGAPHALGIPARAVTIEGESNVVPWLLLANGSNGLVALDPSMQRAAVSLVIPAFAVTSISIGR